jgi:hypothetical protein
MPFKVSDVRFIFDSFTATLMSSKTAFATSVSELSSGDVIILKSWSFLMVREHVRSRYVANVAALFTGVRGSADCSFFIAVFIGFVFEGMLKTSISISRSVVFGLLVFQGLPRSSLSYSFFVPRIGLLLPVVGLSLSVVGLCLSVVGLSLSVVGLSLSVVGLSLSVVGLSLSVVGLSLSVVGLSVCMLFLYLLLLYLLYLLVV